MVDVVPIELLAKLSSTFKVHGSIVGWEFVFCDRKTYEYLLYKDNFFHSSTYGLVKLC